jgi:hypothetical protein
MVRGGRRTIGFMIALLLVFIFVRSRAVLDPALVEFDAEEGFNAGQAWMLLQGHWQDLWRLQYRPYCGGCSAEALLGSIVFRFLPRSWLVWKLIPLAFGLVGLWIGFRSLISRNGLWSGLIFAILWTIPPWAPLAWSLVAWGNHMEAGIIGLMSMVYLIGGRTGRAGLVAGLGVWFSFSGVFAWLAGLGLLVSRRDKDGVFRFLAGGTLGPLIWIWSWLDSGVHPFHTIYAEGESIPNPLRIPEKLWLLIQPEFLAGLFGSGSLPMGGWIGGAVLVALVVVGWLGIRQRSVGVFYLCIWLLLFLCLGFEIRGVGPGSVPWPGALRYFSAAWPILVYSTAEVAGRVGSRVLGMVVVGPLLLSGIVAQVRVTPGSMVVAWERDAVDWDYFRAQASFAMPEESHRHCVATDSYCKEVHAYALARNLATTELREGRRLEPGAFPEDTASQQGVAEAVAQVFPAPPDSVVLRLSDFPPLTLAWGLGQTEEGKRVDPECGRPNWVGHAHPEKVEWAWVFGAACPTLSGLPGPLGDVAREGALFRKRRLTWFNDRAGPIDVQHMQPTVP